MGLRGDSATIQSRGHWIAESPRPQWAQVRQHREETEASSIKRSWDWMRRTWQRVPRSARIDTVAAVTLVFVFVAVAVAALATSRTGSPDYPEAEFSVRVDVTNLAPTDRICAVIDFSDLWKDGDSIGYPLVIGADIKGGGWVHVEATSLANGAISDNGLLSGPLETPGDWTGALGERIAGPSDFCSQLERRLSGRDVYTYAISYFIDTSRDEGSINPSGDGVLSTLVRRARGGTGDLVKSDGLRAIHPPTVSLMTPDPLSPRSSVGFIEMVGETAGFTVLENTPQPYDGQADIWRDSSAVDLRWLGGRYTDLAQRDSVRNWHFALIGGDVGVVASIAPFVVAIGMKTAKRKRVVHGSRIVIEGAGKRWSYTLKGPRGMLFKSKRYDDFADAEAAAHDVRDTLIDVPIEPGDNARP